jgi:hypothetical protein
VPTWGDILNELKALVATGQFNPASPLSPFDAVRRKYLDQLSRVTGRNAVLYATRWTQGPVQEPELVSITPEDLQGFMEVLSDLSPERGLDIVLHSPGGSAEAAEALVTYIRSTHHDVRVFVPHAAMSAATMFACSANRISMGTHSFLGPIDPQFILQTEVGRAAVPAHAILAQFELAKEQCKDATLLPAWLPMLRQCGPALLVQCQLAQQLSESLVAEWLERYMFQGEPEAKTKATGIARALANHENFKSHGRFIDRKQATDLQLKIEPLEADKAVEAAVLAVFHATTHTFSGTPALKIVENQNGKAFLKVQQVVQVQQVQVAPPQTIPLQPS